MADKEDTPDLFGDLEMYRAIFENSLTANLILSIDGEIKKANPKACSLFGYENEDLIGTSVSKLLESNDISNIQKGSESFSGHAIGLKANGSRVVCNILYSMFESQSGEELATLQISENSERTEEIENLKLFESVVKDANDAVVIIKSRSSGRSNAADIVFVNDAYTELTGYGHDELIGQEAKFLNAPKSSMRELARLRLAIEHNQQLETELLNYRKNGEEFWAQVSLSPVFDGEVCTHFIVIAKDVTIRKNREQLKSLESDISKAFNTFQTLTSAVEKTLNLIVSIDDLSLAELWLVDNDKQTIQLTGVTSSNEQSTLFYEETPDVRVFEKGEGLPGITWSSCQTQFWRNLGEREDFIRHKAAETAGIITAYGIPVLHDKKVVGVLVAGVLSDHPRKRYYTPLLQSIGEALGSEIDRKKKEEELERIFSFAPDVICIAGMDGYFKQVNPAMSRLLGFTKDELLSHPISSFTHPDDRLKTEKEIDALNINEGATSFKNRYITKSGKVVWLEWTTRTFYEEGRIYSIARDITEQKELEILLRQANEMAKIGAWEYDVVEENVTWSEVVCQIHEMPSDYQPSLEEGINFYKEGFSRDIITKKIGEAVETGQSFDVELQLVTGKGNVKWVRVIGETEVVQGRVKKMYGSFQDIHDRKSFEERLKNTTNNLPGIIFQYILDQDGNDSLKYLSEGSYEIWGISSEEAMENTGLIWDRIDARDVEGMKESIVKSAETLTKWHYEWRYHHPDGTLRWQDGYGTPKKLVNESVQWDSIIFDITEKKEIEHLLEQASQLAKIGSWEVNLRSSDNEMYWSDMTREILEVENGDKVTLEGMLKYYKPESKQKARKAVSKILDNGGSFDLELQIITGRGREKWIRSIGQVEFEDGDAVRMYGSYQDIDSRKKIEEKLKEKTRHLEAISKLNSALLNYEAWVQAIDENLEVVGRAINADRAYYFENYYDPETGERFTTEKLEWNREGITPQLDNPEMESVPFSAVPELINPMLSHKPSGGIISDIDEDNMTRQVMTDQDIKAFMAVPVIVNGNFHGFLGFDNCTNERYWSREEEKMVKTIASNLATAIERDKIDKEIEKLLNEKNSILESISDAFYTIDTNWNITYFNQEARKLLSDKNDVVLGKKVWDVFSHESGTELFEKYHHVKNSGQALNFEYYSAELETWFDISAYPSAEGISVYLKNIDERKKAQANILKKTSQLDAIASFNGLLINSENWKEAVSQSLKTFGEVVDTNHAYFLQVENSGADGETRVDLSFEWSDEPDESDEPHGESLPVSLSRLDGFVDTLRENKSFSRLTGEINDSSIKETFERKGVKSILGIPVFVNDELHSCLGFSDRREKRDWTDEEISFLQTLSLNLSSAIENEMAKKAVQRVFEERNEILESIGDAFFAVDKNWIVTYWNNVAEEVLRTPRETIVGENLWDIFKDAIDLKFYEQYHIAMEENKTVSFEEYYPTLEAWFEVSAYPSKDGLSVFFRDITERKETEKQLLELNKELVKQKRQLEVSNKELEQFAFVASHDLQEPLRMVTSFLTQLENKYGDELDERAKKYIWFATDGAKRMRQIILDLLNYSRVGRAEINLVSVDLNAVMDGIRRDFKKKIEENNATLTWSGLPNITADRTSVYSLLSNLVSNALKYQSESSRPHITVTADESDDHWKISVSDNGIGINPEYSEKIFSIFQRLHTNDEYSGTGIGLAVCRKIAESHKGKIWVESEEGSGSTFVFTIPK
ncbi:PAS domain S-box protein [Rhodohalobacter sp. 8-1]|uniref:PAS domain S-box protein n=1 Tax=Rhodohalobacter sp. 8-1 TaxID=3131972 RepID=UPI0030ED1DB1